MKTRTLLMFFLSLFFGTGFLYAGSGNESRGGEKKASVWLDPIGKYDPLTVYQYGTQTLLYKVRGSGLYSDVTAAVQGSQPEALTLLRTKFDKDKMLQMDGDTLCVILKPYSAGAGSAIIVFDGGSSGSQEISWTATAVPTKTISQLRADYSFPMLSDPFHLEDLVVTYVGKEDDVWILYAENAGMGIKIAEYYNYSLPRLGTYRVGDKIEDLVGYYYGVTEGADQIWVIADPGEGVPADPVQPVTVSLEDLFADDETYQSRLVRVRGVEFYNRENEGYPGPVFREADSKYAIRQQDGQTGFSAKVLDDSFLESPIPEKADIVGIGVIDINEKYVGMRSIEDLNVNIPLEIAPIEGVWVEDGPVLDVCRYVPSVYKYRVKASGLSGDISLSLQAGEDAGVLSYVTLHTDVLSKEEVESGDGDTLSFTLLSPRAGSFDFKLRFSGENVDSTHVFEYQAMDVVPLDLSDVPASADFATTFLVEDLTVTYVDRKETSPGSGLYDNVYYAQNGQGGIVLVDDLKTVELAGKMYAAGDSFDRLLGRLNRDFETGPYTMSLDHIAPDPVSQGNEVMPKTIGLGDEDVAASYACLVKLENVRFEESGTFESGRSYTVRSDDPSVTETVMLQVWGDVVGSPIPSGKFDVVALSLDPSVWSLGLRALADLKAVEDPAPEHGGNILENPGFEAWGSSSMFNPDGDVEAWTAPLGYRKETETKIEGQFALKIEKPENLPTLYQEISTIDHAFIAGDTYELTIHYYVTEGAADGNDVSLASYWYSSRDGELSHDGNVLNNGTYFTSVGKWEKKTFTTTVPEGATLFYFRLKVGSTATVVFDDFSMCKVENPSLPAEIFVEPSSLSVLRTFPGGVDSALVRVNGRNLAEPISVSFLGRSAQLFSASVDEIPSDAENYILKVYYRPTEISGDEAVLVLASKDADSVKIGLKGECSSETDPAILLDTEGWRPFSVKLGESEEQTIRVSSRNMTDYVNARMEGVDAGQFRISTTALGKNLDDYPFTITYTPDTVGEHRMEVVFYSSGDHLEKRLGVTGICGETDTGWVETFEKLPLGNPSADFYATGDKGEYHLVKALVGSDTAQDVFEGTRSVRLTDNSAYVEMDFDLLDSLESVSFLVAAGKKAGQRVRYGVFLSQDYGLAWTLLGDTLLSPAPGEREIRTLVVQRRAPFRLRIVKLDGGRENPLNIDNLALRTCLSAEVADIDDILDLDDSRPLDFLDETFTGTRHNKPVALEGWRNLMLKGERPWWTFQHKDIESGQVSEYSAKATAYMSNVADAGDFEMWMVTPALNGRNPESKMFTFRVMGDLMPEKDTINTIELYYVEKDGDAYFKQPLQVDMPQGKDYDGEWREFHIDLSQSDVAETFFMAFRFAAPGGKENSTVYYIDDVTYGRTDIPVISCSRNEIEFEAGQYAVASSDTLVLGGKNLTEPIQIGFTGNNPSNFSSDVESVDPQGGKVVVNFMSMQPGIHSAYLHLRSRGAADVFVPITVNVSPAEPTIIVAEKDLDIELRVEEGQETVVSRPIVVNGLLLTEDIRLALEGADARLFGLSAQSIGKDSVNSSFTVNFSPGTAAEAEARVRLSSKGAEDVVIALKGINLNVENENVPVSDFRIWGRDGIYHVRAGEMEEIRVFSVQGKRVLRLDARGRDTAEIRLENYPGGIYVLQVITRQGICYGKVVR